MGPNLNFVQNEITTDYKKEGSKTQMKNMASIQPNFLENVKYEKIINQRQIVVNTQSTKPITARNDVSAHNPKINEQMIDTTENSRKEYKLDLAWRNIFAFTYLHLAALYGLYLALVAAKIQTVVWIIFMTFFNGIGITGGAHRLWSHRAYKAKWPLRTLLIVMQTVALQNDVYDWVRDHRAHHKFTDTDADPYNSRRGFFFSHIGWLCCRKHDEVKRKGALVDMSDLQDDPIVMFQRRHYKKLVFFLAFLIPLLIPMYFWRETLSVSWHSTLILKYVFSLNATWLVNSAAHIWGTKPYDIKISPTENNFVSVFALGEGFHNYHHTFPWDYKTAELGQYSTNFTTAFIDLFAKIGWAYDLKTVTVDMIKKRVQRTGGDVFGVKKDV